MVQPKPASRTPKARHHFIGDEQDAVAPADLGHGRPIGIGRGHGPEGGTDDRLGHERGHSPLPRVGDRGLEFGDQLIHVA